MGPGLPQLEQLMSVEGVAQLFDVSVDWVYDRTAAGEIPSYRLGRHLRYAPSEVWDVLQTWRQGPPEGEA